MSLSNNRPQELCHRFVDEPRAVVAAIDQPMTCEQSRELGRILGRNGYTARIVGGTVAELAALGAKARDKEQRADGKH